MKNIIITIFVCVMVMAALSNEVKAGEGISITLSNGQNISLEGLNTSERNSMIKYAHKINKNSNSTKSIIETLPTNVEDLEKWGKLITGTIKNVCTDLNITVNEFVKTPVGMGVSSLIIYKIAGKDILSKVIHIILVIPIWFILTSLILIVSWYMLSSKKVNYGKTETENDKGKMVITYEGTRMEKRYNWNNNDAKISFGVVMMGAEIAITITSLNILF